MRAERRQFRRANDAGENTGHPVSVGLAAKVRFQPGSTEETELLDAVAIPGKHS
jgi:hypothetical protein